MLRTTLVEVEGKLNGRPITHMSNDAGDIESLTPNHFLLLRANPSYEYAEVSDGEINSTKMWQRSQALANFFWRRFTKEYFPSLTERKKWKEKKQNSALGQNHVYSSGRDGLVRALIVLHTDDELQSTLLKCQEVLDSFQSPKNNWEKRMDGLNENWESSRKLIFNFHSVFSRVTYIRPVVCHLCQGKV